MTKNDNLNINKLLAKSFVTLDLDLKSVLEDKLREYELSKTKVINLLNIDKNSFDDIINGTAKQPNLFNVIKIIRFLDLDLNEALPAILKNQTKENISSRSEERRV